MESGAAKTLLHKCESYGTIILSTAILDVLSTDPN